MGLVPSTALPGDHSLLSEAARIPQFRTLRECTRSALSGLARQSSLELATALLYHRTLNEPTHQAFLEKIQTPPRTPASFPRIGIVPGAFYRNHTNTGADGQKVVGIMKELGCKVDVIPVESFGSLSTNARIIHNWLQKHENESTALISLSKGSCDTKMALSLPGAECRFKNVVAWFSLSGLPLGTPLVSWLNRQPLRRLAVALVLWWRRQSYSVVHELSDAPTAPLSRWPPLPSHLRIVHVVGIPHRRHLAHPWAPESYDRLSPLGPNDGGGLLLADIIAWPGVVLPLWGVDHYLQPPWDIVPILRRTFQSCLA